MAVDLNIGINVIAGPAKKALNDTAKATDAVSEALGRAKKSASDVGGQYNKTGVILNKFGKGVAQQAGYQIADFAVQVQNGTSAIQAFGQQGSQMLAVFGPVGSLLGAAVAIGSALTTAFIGMSQASKGLSAQTELATKTFEGFNSAMSSLNSRINTALHSSFEALENKFGDLADKARGVVSALREIDNARALSSLLTSVEAVKKKTGDLASKTNDYSTELMRISKLSEGTYQTGQIAKFGREFDRNTSSAQQFITAQKELTEVLNKQKNLRTAEQYIEQADAFVRLSQLLPEYEGLLIASGQANLLVAKNMSEANVEATKTSRAQGEAAKTLSDSIDSATKSIKDQSDVTRVKNELFGESSALIAKEIALYKLYSDIVSKTVNMTRAQIDAREAAIKAVFRETQAANALAAAKKRQEEAAKKTSNEVTEAKKVAGLIAKQTEGIKDQSNIARVRNELFGESSALIAKEVTLYQLYSDILSGAVKLTKKQLSARVEAVNAVYRETKALADRAAADKGRTAANRAAAKAALKLKNEGIAADKRLRNEGIADALKKQAILDAAEKTYKGTLARIDEQTESLRTQNRMFGQSKPLIDEQIKLQEILAGLGRQGVDIGVEQLLVIQEKLALLTKEAQIQQEKIDAENLQKEEARAAYSEWKKFNAERERAQLRINQLITDGFRTAGDSLAGLINGTNTWRQALDQVLRKVIDIAAKMGETKSGGFSFGKLAAGLGGLFLGGGNPNAPTSGFTDSGQMFDKFHTGGKIGGRNGQMPGLRSDERMIVGQTGERVLSRGQTAQGGGGGVTVNQTINVSTGVQQTVRAEVMSLAPQIAAQAKAAVLDAKKRGGGFGAAFA